MITQASSRQLLMHRIIFTLVAITLLVVSLISQAPGTMETVPFTVILLVLFLPSARVVPMRYALSSALVGTVCLTLLFVFRVQPDFDLGNNFFESFLLFTTVPAWLAVLLLRGGEATFYLSQVLSYGLFGFLVYLARRAIGR